MENTNFNQNGAQFLKRSVQDAIGAPSNHVVYLVSTAANADASLYPYGVPTLVSNDVDVAKLDGSGSGSDFLDRAVTKIREMADCTIYVIRVERDTNSTLSVAIANTIKNVIGETNAINGQKTGLEALKTATRKPTIIGAPGFSHDKGVAQKLVAMAVNFDAIPVVNLLSDTVAKVTAAGDALGDKDTGFDRAIGVVGNTTYSTSKGEMTMPGDIVTMGLLASVETYENIGHRGVNINKIDHVYEYNYRLKATEGNTLNRHGICYFASTSNGGFSLIGNRCLAGRFISDAGLENEIRRRVSATMEADHGERLTETFIEQKLLIINNWLESLQASEIVAPKARCYLDKNKNRADALSQGRWYIVIEYDGYPVNENPIIELFENNELAAAALV